MLRSFCGAHAQEYRHSVRDWLGSAIPADWRDHRLQLSEDSQKRIRRQWNSILYESGHAAIRWPAEYGGSGLGPIEDLIFQEEAADSFAPDGFGRIQRMLAGAVLLEHGNQEQKAKYLPKIIAGTELWCQGFSEPNVGSDLAAVETEAVRDGPGYWINGKKIWTGLADEADRCILIAKTSRTAVKHQRLSVFLMNMHQSAISVRRIRQPADLHTFVSGYTFNEVTIDNAWVSIDDLVGGENEGWRVVVGVLSGERGIDYWAREYLELREELEQLRQCVDHSPSEGAEDKLKELDTEVQVLVWHVRRIVETELAGRDSFPAMSVLKLAATELWQRVARGGISCDCALHRDYWRNRYLGSRAGTIYGGTSEIQRNVIADRVLALRRT